MSSSRPNVLFLFSDQHKADVLGCEGHPDVSTPNLDRLAAEGVRFARAYCQDGVCVPSRCSMISGVYPRTLGCRNNGDRSAPMREVVSLQSALRASGYRTAAFGKRHLFLNVDEGWDVAHGHLAEESEDSYVTWIEAQGYADAFARDWAAEWGGSHPEGPRLAKNHERAMLCARPTLLPADMTMEAYTTRLTVDLLRECARDGTPFFCWATFYRPHQPYTPLPEYYDRYDRSHWGAGARSGDGIAMPPGFEQAVADLPPMFQKRRVVKDLPWGLAAAHEDQQLFRDAIAAYYAGVDEIDDCAGTILDALDDLGLRDDTIVIYAADHGEFAGAHGIMEKIAQGHNVYEDTLRVPLLVRMPGTVRGGVVSTDLVELVDLYPTLMELCGATRPDSAYELVGRSLVSHLTAGVPVGRTHAFSENWSQSAVIGERYKLGRWIEPPNPAVDFRAHGDMLFDREEDPYELVNRYGDPALAGVRAELESALERFVARVPACEPSGAGA